MQDLYSVRMRASSAASHVSGAERLVPHDRVDTTVNELVKRALARDHPPDRVVVTIDALGDTPVQTIPSLDLIALNSNNLIACRETASSILSDLGISSSAIAAAFAALDRGASPAGENMRGAMLIDAESGERLETDRSRGVRVSRFDWSDEASRVIDGELSALGLTHFRTREALALASKVAHAPGIIVELCWSDDPEYTAGYVASPVVGYIRLPHMKQAGSRFGGRAFFVRNVQDNMVALLTYLQETPVLIDRISSCRTMDGLQFTERNG